MCSAQKMKDLWVVNASLRNSYDLFLGNIISWIRVHLQPVPADKLPTEEECRELWTALGIEPEMVEVLSVDLRLSWDKESGQLLVSEDCEGDVLQKVTGALLCLWSFRGFSEGRWISSGGSCRALICGMLSGLESVVSHIRQHPHTSDYYIHGFEKLTEELAQLVCVMGLSGYPCDAALLCAMDDSRVALTHEKLKEEFETEIAWLQGLSENFWASISCVCGLSPVVLRSKVLSAALAGYAFFHYRVLSEVSKHPWSLGHGNSRRNLEELFKGDQLKEPVAGKTWILLQLYECSEEILEELCQAISLMMDCPWSTLCTEQMHAIGSLVKCQHHSIEQPSLLMRAVIGMYRKLLPGLTVEQKQYQKLAEQEQKIDARQPAKISVRNIYLKMLSQAHKKKGYKKQFVPGEQPQQTLIRTHGALFKNLDPRLLPLYQQLQGDAQEEYSQKISEDLEEVRTAMEVAKKRLEEQVNTRHCLSLFQSRFTDMDEGELAKLLKKPDNSQVKCEKKVRDLLQAPAPLSTQRAEELDKHQVVTMEGLNRQGAKPW